jgi:Steigviridae/Suoliviridae L,D-carboxypeptidase/transpeptidase
MKAVVLRRWPSALSVIGELWLDGSPAVSGEWHRSLGSFCYTLEDTVRPPGVKIQNRTAIPAGKYALTVDFSVRFKNMMPHILDVPMFTGIRIHSGNTDANTEGCILVGAWSEPAKNLDLIGNCHEVFQTFRARLEADLAAGLPCSIEIVNTFQQQTAAPAA